MDKIFQLTSRCLVVLLTLLASCDPFKEDLITPDKQLTVNASVMDYYILPGSSAVIDLSSIVSASFTTATLKVSENPTIGKLTSLDDLTLKYEPLATFNQGDDQFKISFINEGKVLKTAVITVHMKPSTTLFPCSLYAVEDTASIALGSSVSINVLDNDAICGVKKDEVLVSIYQQPKYGEATLNGESITYSSNSGYKSCDHIIYKITTTGDNPKTSFGLVNIRIGDDPCGFTLNEEWNGLNIQITADANVSMCLTILKTDLYFDLTNVPDYGDGEYAFVYDIVNDFGTPRDIGFIVTISTVGSTTVYGNTGMLTFKGHDTEDLLGGPKPTQYFKKRGSNFTNFSEIDSDAGHQPVDLTIDLTWDTGDGTPGSYNIDMYLKQVKDCAGNRWDDFGPGLVRQIGLSENSGTTFESIVADLGSDDLYEIELMFVEGTPSVNATYTITLTTEDGILNDIDDKFSGTQKKMSRTIQMPGSIPGSPGNPRIFKRGLNLYLEGF